MAPTSSAELLQKAWPECFESGELVPLLQQESLPAYFKKCRWFAGKARKLKDVRIKEAVRFTFSSRLAYILVVDAYYRTGKLEQYLLPITYTETAPEEAERAVICSYNTGFIVDAVFDEAFRRELFAAFAQNRKIKEGEYELVFERGGAFEDIDIAALGSRVLNFDQSNTSLFFGERYFFKFYRKLFRLTNPELEVVRYLSEKTAFRHIPVYAASISLRKGRSAEITLGIMQQRVSSEGDAWGLFQDLLTRFIDENGIGQLHELKQEVRYLELADLEANSALAARVLDQKAFDWAALLGRRTAEMHNALGQSTTNKAFQPVAYDAEYKSWLSVHFDKLLEKRQQLLADVMQQLAPEAKVLAKAFKDQIDLIREHFESIQHWEPESKRTRIHGDYHLGQVLHEGGDYIILDFEGEPESSISDRKIKHSPLKDVAGMLRSFHYAAYVALYFGPRGAHIRQQYPQAEQLAESWFQLIASVYLKAYFDTLNRQHLGLTSDAECAQLLRLHLLEKAVYEFGYELNGRPDWVIIPLKGIQQILGEYQTH